MTVVPKLGRQAQSITPDHVRWAVLRTPILQGQDKKETWGSCLSFEEEEESPVTQTSDNLVHDVVWCV